MSEFKGFQPTHNQSEHWTLIPVQFFNELLPHIDDLAELKLTFFLLYHLPALDTQTHRIAYSWLAQSITLQHSLRVVNPNMAYDEVLNHAINKACQRQTILRADSQAWKITLPDALFFLNTPLGRKAYERVLQGDWELDAGKLDLMPLRPTVFESYEQLFGILTPQTAHDLQELCYHLGEQAVRQALYDAHQRQIPYHRLAKQLFNKGKLHDETRRPHLEPIAPDYPIGHYNHFIENGHAPDRDE